MRKEVIPHLIEGEWQKINTIIPADYDSGKLYMISSVFCSRTKRGETVIVMQKHKGFYELDKNKKRIIGYKTKKEAIKKHKELVRKYGRIVHGN